MPKLFLILICVLSLAGCVDQNAARKMMADSEENAFAEEFLEMVRAGDYARVKPLLDTRLSEDDTMAGLRSLHEVLAQGETLSVEPLGFNVLYSNGEKTMNFIYQLKLSSTWLMGNVLLSRKGDSYFVRASHFNPIPDSLEVVNGFSLQGKTPLHYVVLALCVIVPLFILYVLILCIRTRVRHKWLWIIFILLGMVQFQLNWTTGEFRIQPLSVAFLGATALRDGFYAPWVLSCAIPLGAIIFLIRQRVQGRGDRLVRA